MSDGEETLSELRSLLAYVFETMISAPPFNETMREEDATEEQKRQSKRRKAPTIKLSKTTTVSIGSNKVSSIKDLSSKKSSNDVASDNNVEEDDDILDEEEDDEMRRLYYDTDSDDEDDDLKDNDNKQPDDNDYKTPQTDITKTGSSSSHSNLQKLPDQPIEIGGDEDINNTVNKPKVTFGINIYYIYLLCVFLL